MLQVMLKLGSTVQHANFFSRRQTSHRLAKRLKSLGFFKEARYVTRLDSPLLQRVSEGVGVGWVFSSTWDHDDIDTSDVVWLQPPYPDTGSAGDGVAGPAGNPAGGSCDEPVTSGLSEKVRCSLVSLAQARLRSGNRIIRLGIANDTDWACKRSRLNVSCCILWHAHDTPLCMTHERLQQGCSV